jgi:MFS family permease
MQALCLGNISTYTGWVMPVNSLATINKDIGPSPSIFWVPLAYTLGLSVGFLIVGRLSDIFGRRWFFIGGNGLVLIGAIIGSTATHVDDLVAANVLTGLGGAVQISFTIAIAELVPNKHRPLYILGIFFSSFEIACFGPVIAPAFVEHTAAGWRWSYYLNIIVSAMATICFLLFYHPPNFRLLHKNRSKWQQFMRMDFIGFALFTGGLCTFLIGISWGGTVHPWKSAPVIVTIVIGFIALTTFVLYDTYFHYGDPLLPIHLFTSKGYLGMVITGMVGSCVVYSMNLLWPQQIAYLFGGSPTHRGWLACVVGSAALVGQIVGAAMCQYIPRSRYILIGGCICLLAFSAAMVSINPGDEVRGVALMFMACFSIGLVEICSLSLAPLALPSEDIGAAVGALGSIRSTGSSVAIAIYTTILSNKLAKFMDPRVSKAALAAGLPDSSIVALLKALASGDFRAVPGINAKIIAAVAAASAGAAADAFRFGSTHKV